MKLDVRNQLIISAFAYVLLTYVSGAKLEDFKIQEELNNVDLLLIQTTPQESLLYTKSNNGSRDCVLQHYCCNFPSNEGENDKSTFKHTTDPHCHNGVKNCHIKNFKRPINKRIKGCHVLAKEVCSSPCYSCPKFCVPQKEFWCEDQYQVTEKVDNQIFCTEHEESENELNSVLENGENKNCKILQHRYGGIKQSKSCYEREGTKKMCTTINCEFQNVGKECNETTTAIEVSLTEEVCETCSSQGGVCIKSADRTCFGDKSFEPEWVKYCTSDGKDHVKREERSDSDATLAEIIRPLKRVFDKTAEPVRKLFLTSAKSKNELDDSENLKHDQPVMSTDILASKNITPSVSNRKSLTVLNDRTSFERQLAGVNDDFRKKETPKKGSILVITATIVKEDEKTMIEPESINAKIMEKVDSRQTLENISDSAFDSDRNSDQAIVDELLLTVEEEEGVPEEVRSPIYFDPSINNRAPPSGWKPVQLPTEINGTDNSWPPVWYLERSAKNDKATTKKLLEPTTTTESSFNSLSSISSSTTSTSITTSTTTSYTTSFKTTAEAETTTDITTPEEPRTRVSTAALARLCLFQNICSQEDAEDYQRRLNQQRTTTTTIRTTTKAPVRTRRPRTRNPLLVAQLRACMQDSKYCNTNTFNHQHQMVMKSLNKESSNIVEKDVQSRIPTSTSSTTISPLEAARSCVQTGDCRKADTLSTEIFDDIKRKEEKVEKNENGVSDREKQQLRTQVRLCLFAKICK